MLLAVTSGKGGVGKTLITANLAAALAEQGRRVLVLDADLGLANMNVVLKLEPVWTLHHVLHEGVPVPRAIMAAPGGFSILPAGSGLMEFSRWTISLQDGLMRVINEVTPHYDVVLLDTGAGLSDMVLATIKPAHEVLVVATPDPSSLTDAYATLKILGTVQRRLRPMLLVNQVAGPGEGLKIAQMLQTVIDQHWGGCAAAPRLRMLGELPRDEAAQQAVRQRRLVLQCAPGSPLAQGLRAQALRLAAWLETPATAPSAPDGF